MEIDGTPGVALEARVEQPRGVVQPRALGEGQLDDALVGLAGADHAPVRPHGNAAPLPFLHDLGLGLLDERADTRERLTPPVAQLLDPRVDQLRWGRLLPVLGAALCHRASVRDVDAAMHTCTVERIVDLMVRPCATRPAGPILVLVWCTLVLAATGCGRSAGTAHASARHASTSVSRPGAVPRHAPSTYTLMQMNLCLSGLAGCFVKVAYPAVVDEAVARIRAAHPDAVTFNEACRGDVARIAAETG